MPEISKQDLKRFKEWGIEHIYMPKKNKADVVKTKAPVLTMIPASLQAVRDEIGDCTRCKLCSTRTNIVFGVGNPKAELMFIGEAPGHDEDLKAEPFVGRAGQLLTKMIAAMGFQRSDIYIANIIKCRPPDNRYPEDDEVEQCLPFLKQQIAVIKPKIIVSLGNLATQRLLQTKAGITTIHGTFQEFENTTLMPTYHPAFLLRNPNMKKPCWEDLQKVMAFLKMPLPASKQ